MSARGRSVAALGGADREAREVVVARLVEARHLGGLAADQCAFRLPAAFGHAFDDGRTHLGLELSTGEVVEKEQRLGALHDEIVDRHGDEIDADGLVPAGLDGDLDLGADAVGRRHQHRIGKSRPFEIEQAAESADLGVGAGACGRAYQRLDQLHHAVPGIDIDTGFGIGEALFGHRASFALTVGRIVGCRTGSVLGILRLCNGSPGPLYWLRGVPAAAGRHAASRAQIVSIPNLITLARILLVPVVVWAIASDEMRIAFGLFLAAGVSDAVDGFLAKRFGMATALGAYLDPLADKAMLVSIYVALAIVGAIPLWLVILVVSRDIMIVSAVILSWVVDKPVKLKPHPVSKVNTVAQIVLALVVLASLAFNFGAEPAIVTLMALVAVLTLLSVAFYLAEWVRHMSEPEPRS